MTNVLISCGTSRSNGGLFSRRRQPARTTHTTTTTTTTHRQHAGATAPRGGFFSRRRGPVVHHQQRKPSMGDKISGAMLRLKGSLTRRPGQKAAGTRRMNGTDGRGSHRTRRW
ncbi:hypothetical protein BN1723_001225 [Verticillium longisporum]|uniref:Uncharacterized protein n=1 Tax=Verticillium longisporum TaxID=100787 RepID=A0A0G4NKI4_VERLO|nr:hypothetical protein BN1723_001225 [Verticillium longisporum]